MEKEYIKGGEFLIAETVEIFTPEDLTEEQRMIGETTREFVDNEVRPQSCGDGTITPGKSPANLSKRPVNWVFWGRQFLRNTAALASIKQREP